MKKAEPTKVEGIRLTPERWRRFRIIWKVRGRDWFDRLVDREYNKTQKDVQNDAS